MKKTNMSNQKINKGRPAESLRDLLMTDLVVHMVADVGHLKARIFGDQKILLDCRCFILGKAYHGTLIDVVNYLVDEIHLHHGKSFLIATFLQRYHTLLSTLIYALAHLGDFPFKSSCIRFGFSDEACAQSC
uniref:Uncharacterized protein n=1 Tax=Lactuca sativa TaxID=4236 RepID=A0A9R1VXK8_LACSA|nr:hypothetical protein LSAT_V11C400206340 [Lactuca sativa]